MGYPTDEDFEAARREPSPKGSIWRAKQRKIAKKMNYRKEVLRNMPNHSKETMEKKLSRAGLGIAGEGAEVLDVMLLAAGVSAKSGAVADIIKKILHHGVPLESVRQKLILEMGDVYWYLEALCDALKVTRNKVMVANVAKLRARHPKGWTPQSQQDKADEKK